MEPQTTTTEFYVVANEGEDSFLFDKDQNGTFTTPSVEIARHYWTLDKAMDALRELGPHSGLDRVTLVRRTSVYIKKVIE